MADIFVSYSVRDSPKAGTFAGWLGSLGYSVWIDKQGIDGAQTWTEEIVGAINNCKVLAVLISPNSMVSHNVGREIHLALDKKKHVLPLILEEAPLPAALEYPLAGLQRIGFTDEPAIIRSLERLLKNDSVIEDFAPQHSAVIHDPTKKRLAVMPFDDLSPARDNDWFADGMMDELIGTLGSLSELVVAPRSDVMYYKGKHVKARDIADDLGVRYLVEGSVLKVGTQIRITPTLTDTATSKVLWSEKYQGSFADIFAFQESVARQISDALMLTLTPREARKIEEKPTDNTEAYELFMKAEENVRRHEQSNYDRAFALYSAALDLDPKFVRAHYSLVNECLGYYRNYSQDEKWLERAEESLRAARALDGENAYVLYGESMLALYRGDAARAVELAQRGIRMDPTDPMPYAALGYAYKTLGKVREAVQVRTQYVALRPNDTNARISLLVMIQESCDRELLERTAKEAVPVFEKHLRKRPDDTAIAVEFATVLSWANERAKAMQIANDLAKNERLDSVALYNLAALLSREGESDRALGLLSKSIAKGYVDIETMRRDPDLDPLRGMPEFEELIAEFAEPVLR